MTATALRVEEQAAPYLVAPLLTDHLDTFASAPEGFKRLRELVLNLAVRGRLVPQGQRGWKQVCVSDICSLVTDGEHATPARTPDSTAIPLVTAKNVRDGQMDYGNTDYVPMNVAKKCWQRCKPEAGDVLMVSVGATLGRLTVLREARDMVLVRSVTLLRPVATLVTSDYLALHLNSPSSQQEIWSVVRQSAQPCLYLGKSAALKIALPPLTEQSRIVAKVEELMALIDALEAKVGAGETARGKLLDTLLATLADSPDAAATAEAWAQLAPRLDLLLQTPADVDRLQQTLLALAVKGRLVPQDPKDKPAAELLKRIRAEKERLVAQGKIKRDKPQAAIADDQQPFHPPNGWEWVRFGDIHQVAGGVTLGRKLTGKRTVSHPYLRVANVQRGALDLGQIKEIEIAEEELDRYRLRRDDLLITEGGDWDKVGRTAIWRGEIEPCLHQNHIFRARRITSGMNVEWVALFMNSAIAMAYFQASAKQTTNLASINMGELKHCAVPLPPLPEQSRIAAAAASLTALCDHLRERLAVRRALSAKLAAALTESALA